MCTFVWLGLFMCTLIRYFDFIAFGVFVFCFVLFCF